MTNKATVDKRAESHIVHYMDYLNFTQNILCIYSVNILSIVRERKYIFSQKFSLSFPGNFFLIDHTAVKTNILIC